MGLSSVVGKLTNEEMGLFHDCLLASSFSGQIRNQLQRLLEKCSTIGYMLNMKLSVTLDRDEDGIWVAECPSIPGCVSQGKTKPEAIKNIKEAIALCLEVRAERGLPLTVETQQVEVLV